MTTSGKVIGKRLCTTGRKVTYEGCDHVDFRLCHPDHSLIGERIRCTECSVDRVVDDETVIQPSPVP